MDEVNPYECGPEETPRQPEIDPAELARFAASLDERSEGFEPYFQLTLGEKGAFVWTANRAALLRYAASFLRLAGRDPESDSLSDLSERPAVEHFIIEQDKNAIVEIRHTLAIPEPQTVEITHRRRLWLKDRIGLVGCAIVGFFLISLVLSGCAFWYMIMTGSIG